jgi:HD-like signal output (HDOD) protein
MNTEMAKHEVYKTIAADLAKGGELVFPTSAQVAMKIRHALNDPDCHIQTAAKLIKAEPLLSARIVAMANSAAYNRSGRSITDVATSVAHLGFRTVRSLATALVARQLAGNSRSPAHQALTTQLWEHTAHVAALAHVIARKVTHVDAETAMFAGIVHEVGGFYMLSRAQDFPELIDGDFDAWTEFGEAEVGRAVLQMLAVPEPVVEAISAYWEGFLAIPPVTLADTLLLAEELAPTPSPLHYLGDQKLGAGMAADFELTLGEDTLSHILNESAEVVVSLTDALKF